MGVAVFLKEENPFILKQVLGRPLAYFPVKEAKKVFSEVYISGIDLSFAERKDIFSAEELFKEIEDGEEIFFSYPSVVGIFSEDVIEARESGSCLFTLKGKTAGGILKKGEKVSEIRRKIEVEGVRVENNFSFIEALEILRFRKIEEIISEGGLILDPYSTWIDEDVGVEEGAVIEPNVTIKGWVKIEKGAMVKSYTYIENVPENMEKPEKPIIIRKNASVGPFSRLRKETEIGEEARIGNFVEVKKSTIEKGVKALHLTYIGDAEIGERSNIGAGTITCNYDGFQKNKTKIGKRVFVGSGVELVAPVEVEDDVYIGAGSTVTERVPSFSLAIARARQVIKEKWVLKKRKFWKEKLKKS